MDTYVGALVHIAGVDVQVGAYLRQRCSWCGAVLVEYDLESVARPLKPGEDPENPEPWRPATWTIGGLVLIDGGFSTTIDHKDGDRLPENACAQLPHDLTGAP